MYIYKIVKNYIRKDNTLCEGDEEKVVGCCIAKSNIKFETLKDVKKVARSHLKEISDKEGYTINGTGLKSYKETINYDEQTYIETIEEEMLEIIIEKV